MNLGRGAELLIAQLRKAIMRAARKRSSSLCSLSFTPLSLSSFPRQCAKVLGKAKSDASEMEAPGYHGRQNVV